MPATNLRGHCFTVHTDEELKYWVKQTRGDSSVASGIWSEPQNQHKATSKQWTPTPPPSPTHTYTNKYWNNKPVQQKHAYHLLLEEALLPWQWLNRKKGFCGDSLVSIVLPQSRCVTLILHLHQGCVIVAQSHSSQEGSLTSARISARCSLHDPLVLLKPGRVKGFSKGLISDRMMNTWCLVILQHGSCTSCGRRRRSLSVQFLFNRCPRLCPLRGVMALAINHSLMLLWFTRTPKINRLVDSVYSELNKPAARLAEYRVRTLPWNYILYFHLTYGSKPTLRWRKV